MVFTYRIGELIEILILVTLWLAIYSKVPIVSGFTQNEMITYVLVGNIFYMVVRDFSHRLFAREIVIGKLSFYLVKPLSHLRHFLAATFGRSTHILMGIVSQIILISLFHKFIIINVSAAAIGVIIVMLMLARINELLTNYLLGMIAFWTDEVEPIQDTLSSIRRFLSGGLFPLSLLPIGLATFTYGLPFAYYFFFPMQLFLGKVDIGAGLRGLLIQSAWILILYLAIRIVWARGLKRYEGVNS